MPPIDSVPSTPGVTYRLIPNWSGYAVGDDGTVWSSKAGYWQRLKGGTAGPSGGKRRTVLLCRNGKPTTHYVHRLVLEAFAGPCPEGLECCHNDGDPFNNALVNLRWDTHAENMRDMCRIGGNRNTQGGGNVNAKLTEMDIQPILDRRAAGETLQFIATAYKVGPNSIRDVVQGYTWNHVSGKAKKAKNRRLVAQQPEADE